MKSKIPEEYLKKHLLRNTLTSVLIFLIGFLIFRSNQPEIKNDTPESTEYKFTVKKGYFILDNGDTLLKKK